jgi:hypothetical protein
MHLPTICRMYCIILSPVGEQDNPYEFSRSRIDGLSDALDCFKYKFVDEASSDAGDDRKHKKAKTAQGAASALQPSQLAPEFPRATPPAESESFRLSGAREVPARHSDLLPIAGRHMRRTGLKPSKEPRS